MKVMNLPTGTVTFLFTDIESSTKRWERYPKSMNHALKRHDEILSQAIESNNGYVFKTVGDAFCAAFHTALDAVLSAIDAQLIIQESEWDLPDPMKVRMAIHTGEAVERNGDYYGPAVNRVARIEATCYGNQIVLSLVTAELIRDNLPDEVELKDLGSHRLKDLRRSEHIFQVVHPDLKFRTRVIREDSI